MLNKRIVASLVVILIIAIYCWNDRFILVPTAYKGSILINKWTGKACFLLTPDDAQRNPSYGGMKTCNFSRNKFALP